MLRARLDLDNGRMAHAAIELRAAYAAALAELPAERREDLAIRIAELDKLRGGVDEQARVAFARLGGRSPTPVRRRACREGRWEPATGAGKLDGEVLRHALGRLEATLRARTAPGFRVK